MKDLNFSKFKMRIKNKENLYFIFDIIRKNWYLLTKEEWVRQHCIHFLIFTKKYPKSLVNVEKKILINGVRKRYDIVVYSKQKDVIILVECKAYNVNINQDVFDQIAKYNLELKSRYLMISNGLSHFYYTINYELNEYLFMKDLPTYKN
tara:strand:- start:98 stop:544 length:447 start_codon:yes stop_codon:yes gene_type:complete